MKKLVVLLLLIPTLAMAQSSKRDSIWKPMNFFLGEWKGTSEGAPGKGNDERSYQFVLGQRYIEVKNKSMWLPKGTSTKGEVHEDWGYISYDNARKIFVLRQFHIEGFVNQYRLESISQDGKSIVFISENIENIPSGWRAKESYHLINDKAFIETFELAEPNKDFTINTKALFTRK
ncbi:MAG: hypothetical protein Q8908_15750 [Bacteroidota bacterium]|nr:hypothetical protein [Bacteroidota bacterium]